MPWLLKVFLVGALLGSCVFFAAAIPWLPARLGFLAVGGFVFLWSMRDPALTYRRAFHFLIVLPAIPLGFSASAELFGADDQQGGILEIIVDGSQVLPPLLLFGLAMLCLIGDAILMKKDRSRREALYQAEAVEAEFVEARKLLQVDFPFRPTRDVAISGAGIQLRGIGNYSDRVQTWVKTDADMNEATKNIPQSVAAGTLARVTVSLALDEQAFRRIRKRRDGVLRRFPITGAVKLWGDSRIEPLPIKLP